MESPHRIACLDGFRGFAILMVTVFRFGSHAFTEDLVGRLPSKIFLIGTAGVDFFFVLSGFLITGLLLDAKETSDHYYSRFYVRRALRIFPLYFASLFLFLVVLPFLGNTKVTDTIDGSTLHLWIYTTNLAVAWNNEWCFGCMNHFWSLAIEEQFYLVWPVAIALLRPKKIVTLCIVSFVILAVSRVCFSVADLGDASEKSFTLFRMDGLLLGAIASIHFRNQSIKNSAVDRSRWNIGLIACLGCYGMSLLLGNNDYTIRYTIVSLLATCLLLSVLSSKPESWQRKIFEIGWLRSLGKYSYAMYIFQGPLVPLVDAYVSPDKSIANAFLYALAMFATTYLLSVLSWYAFERWFLELKERIPFSKKDRVN
jgi:peptidoglycan/LPS O-acetylase OafA/YrhL